VTLVRAADRLPAPEHVLARHQQSIEFGGNRRRSCRESARLRSARGADGCWYGPETLGQRADVPHLWRIGGGRAARTQFSALFRRP